MDERDRLNATLTSRQRLPRSYKMKVQRNLAVERRAPESSNNLNVKNVYEMEAEPEAMSAEAEASPLVGTPWSAFTQHKQLDAFIVDNGLIQPSDWSMMLISEKKAWLDSNVQT